MKKVLFVLLFFININVYANERIEVKLDKCVDGDTSSFIVNGEIKKVRFLAIDTPESVHPNKPVEAYGKEASTFTCEKLTNAKKIEIEYDSKSDKTDKYGRILGWIYVDGILLQKELVSDGYAKVAYIYGEYSYIEELCSEEKNAYEKKLNMWSLDSQEGYCIGKKNSKNIEKEKEPITIKEIIYIIIASILLYLIKILKRKTKKVKI